MGRGTVREADGGGEAVLCGGLIVAPDIVTPFTVTAFIVTPGRIPSVSAIRCHLP